MRAFLFIPLLAACSTAPSSEHLTIDSTSFSEIVTIHKKSPEEPSEYIRATRIEDISPAWVKVTKQDSNYIIYEPCNSGNPTITITNDNGPWQLILFYGQESVSFEITEFTPRVEDHIDSIDFYYDFVIRPYGGSATSLATLHHNPIDGEISTWSGVFGGRHNMFVTAYDAKLLFPIIKQPCKECWGEGCEEAEQPDTTGL